jgi:hypothetical protein
MRFKPEVFMHPSFAGRSVVAKPNHTNWLNQFQGRCSTELMSSSGFFLEKKPPVCTRKAGSFPLQLQSTALLATQPAASLL